MEAALIFVGVLAIMATYTLRQDVAGTAGADADALVTTGHALVAIHDWTFLLGPGLMAVLNALLIGSVMYRSRMLPRWIPTLGLIGAPLLLDLRHGRPVRRLGPDLRSGHAARAPDRHLGVLLRRLHDRQGLEARRPSGGRLIMIQIDNVTKRYGTTVAVDRLSFEVREGEVTGFLGPNGAGKSTTMRMMVGLDLPTSGRVTIDGRRYADLRFPLTTSAPCSKPGRAPRAQRPQPPALARRLERHRPPPS